MTERIAVIGMACRFPGAASPDELWRNLREGRESIRSLSDGELDAAGVGAALRGDPRYVRAKGVLDDADAFDAGLFGVTPREAALMDPQQRVFLETAWSALDDAAYDPRRYEGRIGVFAGSILSMYLLRNLAPNRDIMEAAGNFQIAVGNDPTFLATSTSYHLDLRGPSVSVGTACSTSLVAVHLACQSLLSFESDMAVAGGVSIHLPLTAGYRHEDGGILSPDGHCRPFDAAAAGTVSSDGAGVVVLKRLSEAIADGDVIHAVIRGSAMNNDGRAKVGYTAPSVRGEAQVIAEAIAIAEVEPETIVMLEAHGAGTLLGDPIEVSALVEAFGDCGGKRGFCALGSVKSNIGHVDAAAGIAGLIKAVLALRHRQIPPTLHFREANPQMNLAATPFYVNGDLVAVDAAPMRAGVSSFGIGGTNVHVVLEEAPHVAAPASGAGGRERPPLHAALLLVSARTPAALDAATDRLAASIADHDLADVSYTLRYGRRELPARRAILRQQVWSGVAPARRPSIALMFPGLGDHYAGMGCEIYDAEPVFRAGVDRCLEHLGPDVREFFFVSRPKVESSAAPKLDLRAMLGRTGNAEGESPALAQPAIFAIEIALAELLRSWGIEPDAMIGHSIGELAAACVAGVFSLPDALKVVAARARLIAERVPRGAMLAVPMEESELLPLLPAGVALGAINAARLCVASGEESGIAALAEELKARGVSAQRLRATHAYHSPMMETLVEPLAEVLRGVKLHAPKIPYISCLTGTWITDAEATDPAYWTRHLCRTVRFHDGLSRLLADRERVFVEAGPGQGLTSHALMERARSIPTMRWSYALQSEIDVLLGAAGQLWVSGAPIDTTKLGARGRRVQLPAYPFERQRYWIDPPSAGAAALLAAGKRPDVADWFYVPTWKPSPRPRASANIEGQTWLLIGGDAALADELRARGIHVTTEIDPDQPPDRIVHLDATYDSIVQLLQHNVRLDVVTSQLDIPEKAMLRAPLMVAPQENPGLVCRCIEMDAPNVELLMDELLSDATEPMVAYRDGRRWLPAYEPVRLERTARPPFRERGVYLITGGLGGVGLILAEHLARTVRARLVLIGRSEPSAAKLDRIQALDAEVLVMRADVARADDMRRVLDEIDARFGELHGVIHAAGSIGAATFRELRNVPPADAESQFVAKVRGLTVLDEVLAGRNLDFVLLMSSLSAVLGGLGFTAYAAANLFMDAFARRRPNWISADWDSWRVADAQRPAIAGFGASVSEFVMEPEEGAEAFARIVAEKSLDNVIVSCGSLEARLRMWINRSEPAPTIVQRERPALETTYQAPRGELETELATIWQELFGIAPIGVNDNFFALGGHSLLATQLNARLSSKLHVEMSLAALLQAPTIAELAVAIVTEQAEMADPEMFEEMLTELER